MADPLVLYSVNTLLAYRINERFYDQVHYVWCSSFFSAATAPPLDVQMPPSSTPCDICQQFLEDVSRRDRHSARIRDNRSGGERGIDAKREEGVISGAQQRELKEMVAKASPEEFRPLLYIIPFQGVAKMVREVPLDERAHPFSPEYLIEKLPRSRFDVLEWVWR